MSAIDELRAAVEVMSPHRFDKTVFDGDYPHRLLAEIDELVEGHLHWTALAEEWRQKCLTLQRELDEAQRRGADLSEGFQVSLIGDDRISITPEQLVRIILEVSK